MRYSWCVRNAARWILFSLLFFSRSFFCFNLSVFSLLFSTHCNKKTQNCIVSKIKQAKHIINTLCRNNAYLFVLLSRFGTHFTLEKKKNQHNTHSRTHTCILTQISTMYSLLGIDLFIHLTHFFALFG